MLLFLDEAGDTWFKFTKWSSKYFVVWLVVFEDKDEALACDQRISLLKRELWLKNNYEFHFKKDNDQVKSAFCSAVSNYNFFYYGIAINKERLRSKNMRVKETFYKYTCSLIFENAKDKMDNAILVVDKQWWEKFEKELQTYIKRKMNAWAIKKIKKVRMEESHRNNLLQLADYVASWIYRKLNKPKVENAIDLLSHREIYVQIWPKEKPTSIPKESAS